mmetsp:Transcript_29223/g.64663  ORF Transcript_29223/g.64663 Transcript_29223/m.64663 type:complete len:468 (-) Transcript_29223:248-1651(-)
MRVLVPHHRVPTRQALHHEVQGVHTGDLVGLLRHLGAVTQDGVTVALKLPLCEAVPLQAAHLLDAHCSRLAPLAGHTGDGEGGHSTPLAPAVTDVQLNAEEGGVGVHVPAVDPELEDGEHDADHEQLAQVGHAGHGLDRQLAEKREHEVLQQGVAEHLDLCRPLAWRQGPVPMLVHHRRPHVMALLQRCGRFSCCAVAMAVAVGRGCGQGLPGGGQLAECLDDELAGGFGVAVQVAHHVEGGVTREVPLVPEGSECLMRPGLDLVHLADWEPVPQVVLLMQVLQQLAVHAVLNGVHHLGLSHDGLALLLNAGGQELGVERNLLQGLQDLGQHRPARCAIDDGRMHVEHCVVEVCVCIGPGSSTQQVLAPLGAEEGHVLHQVGNTLLVLLLIHAASMDLQVGLKALRWQLVGQDDVAQPVLQLPNHQALLTRNGAVQHQRLNVGGTFHTSQCSTHNHSTSTLVCSNGH